MTKAVIGYIAYDLKKNSLYDPITLCPLEVPYSSTVVIIDKSDPWNRRDSSKIKRILMQTFNNLSNYEKFVIKVIEPNNINETEIKTYFAMCNPGNKANPLYQNSRKILKKYKTLFQKPLNKVMKSLTSSTITKTSPILEAIQESITYNKSENVNLIIISDLLEYTEEYFNFYKHIPSSKDAIDEFSLNGTKINSMHIEYISRKHYRDKIKKSLRFFQQMTTELHGKFSKHLLLKTN